MSDETSKPKPEPEPVPLHSAGEGLAEAARRKGSLMGTLSAVAWSFLGIRRSRDHAQDIGRLNPIHVVIAGLVAAILFVLMLVLLIQWVVQSGVAR